MSTKRVDLNAIIPLSLDSKVQTRKDTYLVPGTGEDAFLIATYNEAGSFVLYGLGSKKLHKVNRKNPLKQLRTQFPFVVSLHEKDKHSNIEVYDINSHRSVGLRWDNDQDEVIAAAIPTKDGVIAVGKSHFYRSAAISEKEMTKIAAVGGEIATGLVAKGSVARGVHLMLVATRQVQVWNIQTGILQKNLVPKQSNSTFLLTAFEEEYIVATTATDITISRLEIPSSITIPTKVTPSAICAVGDTLFVGDLDGVVSSYSLSTGKLVHHLNKSDVGISAVSRSLMTQMRSRVNIIRVYEEFLFSVLDTGDVAIYLKDAPEQTDPLKVINARGRVSAMLRVDKQIYMHVTKRDKKTEELYSWPTATFKKIRFLMRLSSQKRLQGTTEADYEKEVVKTGFLNVKLTTEKHARGKKRYCVLRNNGVLYAYRSPQDSAPVETYMLKNKSVVKLVKGKAGALNITISPSVQVRLSGENQADAESWLEAISTTIKEMGLAEVWEIDPNDIKLEKSVSGDQVTVGKGGSSTVMKGTYNGRLVAIKYYKQNDLNMEEFKNEVLLLHAVKHPSILPVYGITKGQDTAAIVMPYVDKGSLFDVLHNGKIDVTSYTWKLYLKFAFDIARALEYLHSFRMNGVRQPIIHADLKSANLLVNSMSACTTKSSIMLIDFGISVQKASILDPDNAKRQGTISYMSPELIKGDGKYTPKIDVYAFGVLLWEMMTMKIPYHKMSTKQIESQVLKGERPSIPSNAPQELIDLIESCWAASPDDRPSFGEIMNKLVQLTATINVDGIADSSVLGDLSPRGRSGTAAIGMKMPLKRLYGRKKEMIKLLKVVSEFGAGGNAVVMIKGKSGTGKSELLNRFANFAALEGFIMEGRFSKDDKTPYSAIRSGLRNQMVCGINAWSPEERQAISNKIRYTFDATGLDLIANLVPEVAPMIGRDGDFQRTDISADKFMATLTKLFRKMSNPDHPVIMMLDDLQWADPASLTLLAKVCQDLDKDPETRLLVVGAYRDSDVDESHPLSTLLLSKLSMELVTEVVVKPLGQNEVAELIQDSFPAFEPRKVESLAAAIYDRSLGVPFMVHQFLQSLTQADSVLSRTGSSVSDELIQNIRQTDNILVANLTALKPDLYSLLVVASYFSADFSSVIISSVLKTLALSVANGIVKVTRLSPSASTPAASRRESIESLFEEAIAKGLVESKGKHVYLLKQERIRDALQSSISTDQERQLVHLELARAMAFQLKTSKKAAEQMDIFETVHHYSAARSAVKQKDELVDLAQLYLRASETAISVGDYAAAFPNSKSAVDILDAYRTQNPEPALEQLIWDAWNSLSWINMWSASDREVAAQAVKLMGAMANAPLRKALAGRAKISNSFVLLSNFNEGIAGFLEAAEALGAKTDKLTAQELLSNTKADEPLAHELRQLTGGDPDALRKREKVKQVSDDVQAALTVFSVGMNLTTLIGLPHVSGYVALTWVKYTLQNPGVPMQAEPIFQLAQWIANSDDAGTEIEHAKQLWELALSLWKTNKSAPLRTHTWNHIVESYFHRVKSWKSVRKMAVKGKKVAAEEGDPWADFEAQVTQAYTSVYLNTLDDVVNAFTDVKIQVKTGHLVQQSKVLLNMWTSMYRRLRGEPLPMLTENLETVKQLGPIFGYGLRAMDLGYLAIIGSFEEAFALQMTNYESPVRPKRGDFPTVLFEVMGCLILQWKLRSEQDPEKRKLLTHHFDGHHKLLQSLELGGGNWSPFLRLIEAEELYSATAFAMLEEEQVMSETTVLTMILSFNEAMKLADRHKAGVYNWVAGYAAERCAELATESSLDTMATFYALEAIRRYDNWGAKVLVNKVRTVYASRLAASSSSSSPRESGALTPTSTSGSQPGPSRSPSLLHLGGSSLHVGSEEALPHLALSRTYARALTHHFKHLNDNLPQELAEKSGRFYQELHNFLNYLSSQSIIDELTPEDSGPDTDSGTHSSISASISESDTDDLASAPVNMPLSDIIEQVAVAVSYGLAASDPPIATFIPPTEMPSVIANGGALQQLLQHVLMSFITYHRGDQVSLVVRGEKTSSTTHVLKFQITDFAPENLDSLLMIPHSTSLPAELATNFKYCEQLLDSFQGEMFFRQTEKRTVLHLSVGVTAVYQVAVSVQNTLLADIVKRYLSAWGYEYAVMTGREVIANASTLKLVIMDSLESSIDVLRQFRARGGASACVVNIGGKPPSAIADAASTLLTRTIPPTNVKTELHKLVISTLSIV